MRTLIKTNKKSGKIKAVKSNQLKLPKARQYSMLYRKKCGETQAYSVSNPIEQDEETITVYAIGRGIRTFRVENILEMRELGRSILGLS